MIGFAPAKINLGLFITGKRPDGFHALESCFWPVQWQDVLEVHKRPEPGLALRVSGIPIPGAADDNLIHRAYTLLHDRYPIGGVDAHLFKALPMGAGLGGGSSDAVCMLKLMNVLWDLNLTDEEGLELAALLGSDCPFFWFSQPSLVTGRGEHLSKMEVGFPGPLYVTIIHPGIHIATKTAFSAIQPQLSDMDWNGLFHRPIEEWQHILRNDFESGITQKEPVVGDVLMALKSSGAAYVQMTGTGSACYGIFTNEEEALAAHAMSEGRGWTSFSALFTSGPSNKSTRPVP